jgi:hypothetical protein
MSLAIEHDGNKIMVNTVATGAVLGMLGMDIDNLIGIIKDAFGKKGDEVINANIIDYCIINGALPDVLTNQPCCLEKGSKKICLPLGIADRGADQAAKLFDLFGCQVDQVGILAVIPNLLELD